MKHSIKCDMKCALLCLVLACLSGNTLAQDTWLFSFSSGASSANSLQVSDQNNVQFDENEVYHFVANRYDGTNRDGAHLYYEFFLSHNTYTSDASSYSLDLEGTHLQLGGAYEWAEFRAIKPYIAATLGTSYYDSRASSGEPFWSGSFGIGSRYHLNPRFSLKLEARAIGTMLDGELDVFCDGDDCALGVESDIWWQQHITAGFSWSF